MNKMIELQNVTKIYSRGPEKVHALRNVSLTVEPGEFLAIVGPSGSGKTTLLQLIGCMDRPTEGKININGKEVSGLNEAALTGFRSESIGFVFQQFFLIPTLTALENVELPMLFGTKKNHRSDARELLRRIGLGDRLNHRPSELSGGEMQRAAIARALINSPEIILTDEPTGNLDSENANNILRLFKELNSQGQTILMVTHNTELAAQARRVVQLKDGQLD